MVRPTRIVVGYHPSQASLHALGVAKDFGIRMDAEVHVVHGIDLGDFPINPDAVDWEAKAAALIQAEKETVETAMADYPGRWAYHELRKGAYEAIYQIAETFQPAMIVVGHRRSNHGRLTEYLGGLSLGRRLLNGSGYPVLLVTARGQPS
jgi:nucleotide-binding universal stress UspA family protein